MNTPFWKRPIVMLLLVVLAVGGGIWFAMDQPMPGDWADSETRPEIRLPEFLRTSDANRIYCAESTETGRCRCIAADGSRPDISEDECRRRARQSATQPDG